MLKRYILFCFCMVCVLVCIMCAGAYVHFFLHFYAYASGGQKVNLWWHLPFLSQGVSLAYNLSIRLGLLPENSRYLPASAFSAMG